MTDMTTYINAIINLCMDVSDKWLLTYGFIAFKRQCIKYDNHVITMINNQQKQRFINSCKLSKWFIKTIRHLMPYLRVNDFCFVVSETGMS